MNIYMEANFRAEKTMSCILLSGFYTLVCHDDDSLCSPWSIHSRSEGSVD